MVIRPFKEEPPPPSFIRWSVTQKRVKVTELKNMMMDTWDGVKFYPRPYDMD